MGFFWASYGLAISNHLIWAGSLPLLPLQGALVWMLHPFRQPRTIIATIVAIAILSFGTTALWGWNAGVAGTTLAMFWNRLPQIVELIRAWRQAQADQAGVEAMLADPAPLSRLSRLGQPYVNRYIDETQQSAHWYFVLFVAFVVVLNLGLYRSRRTLAAFLVTLAVTLAVSVGWIGWLGGQQQDAGAAPHRRVVQVERPATIRVRTLEER